MHDELSDFFFEVAFVDGYTCEYKYAIHSVSYLRLVILIFQKRLL